MKAVSIAAALAAVLGSCTGSHAEPFPSRPVTLIVPFPAGGPTDTLARILTERMRVALGQPIVIENVTGAGASIGASFVFGYIAARHALGAEAGFGGGGGEGSADARAAGAPVQQRGAA